MSTSLIPREYSNLRGVDFSNNEVSIYRSPDSVNMYKNYKSSLGKYIETRPDIELHKSYSNSIFGHFFYSIDNIQHEIIHSGTKLYDNGEEIYTGMNIIRSSFFVFNNILYILDGINYLEYDGISVKSVVGYIPTTTINKSPAGDGTSYQKVNLLTGVRSNTFIGDGKSKDYYLDSTSIDSDYSVLVSVNGTYLTLGTDYTVTSATGKVTFTTAPSEPASSGNSNVVITFRRTISGHRSRIENCKIIALFDNRVFFSGNPNYPNAIFHCELENPRYISDVSYYNEGLDLSPVRCMIPGNNALWVSKKPSQANTTVFYHTPVIDSELGKTYPSNHSTITTGCIATGINFNDDIVFFSERGMEAISGDINSEQLISHRSSLVDSKMLNEANYEDLILEEWQGYLLVIFGKHIYLADSRQKFTNIDHTEYEWYYWELSEAITCTRVKDGILYLGTSKGIYKLTNTTNSFLSYWSTPNDAFKYPNYQKTTNKRGSIAEVLGSAISIEARTDNNPFELIGQYNNKKGYIVFKVRKKDWRTIQIRFSSLVNFSLVSVTLESFLGAYTKR